MREEMATERFAFFLVQTTGDHGFCFLGTKRKTKWVISFPLFNGSDAVVRRQILIHSSGEEDKQSQLKELVVLVLV